MPQEPRILDGILFVSKPILYYWFRATDYGWLCRGLRARERCCWWPVVKYSLYTYSVPPGSIGALLVHRRHCLADGALLIIVLWVLSRQMWAIAVDPRPRPTAQRAVIFRNVFR